MGSSRCHEGEWAHLSNGDIDNESLVCNLETLKCICGDACSTTFRPGSLHPVLIYFHNLDSKLETQD
ncbi:hypothetical protein RvY_07875 [Ramazzottius varieornatus]|uniref:Uncharacterized protein n=1 Tax=Ramazzottius varieornatus TaxID=947166 RepID=A0A1D1V3T9_RAMVA|nr:hypothetical protein RvY_07875 [Ramazzottius varieornatus]